VQGDLQPARLCCWDGHDQVGDAGRTRTFSFVVVDVCLGSEKFAPEASRVEKFLRETNSRGEALRAIFVARSGIHFDCLFHAKRRSLAVEGRCEGLNLRNKRRRLYFAALYLYSRARLRSAPCPGS
jgi:hypothetical protein